MDLSAIVPSLSNHTTSGTLRKRSTTTTRHNPKRAAEIGTRSLRPQCGLGSRDVELKGTEAEVWLKAPWRGAGCKWTQNRREGWGAKTAGESQEEEKRACGGNPRQLRRKSEAARGRTRGSQSSCQVRSFPFHFGHFRFFGGSQNLVQNENVTATSTPKASSHPSPPPSLPRLHFPCS
eukprot:3113161-Rhodomonas_salina.7